MRRPAVRPRLCRHRRRATAWAALVPTLVLTLAGCTQAHDVAVRTERETFCLKWRAVKEVAKHSDSPVALWALDKARSGLRGAVPDQQRANLDAVLRAARDFAAQTDEKVGNLDETAVDLARREGSKGLTKAVENLNGYCKGSLTG